MVTGCGEDDRKLGTLSVPTNIQAVQDSDRSLIIFDGVENAEYYDIYINDISVTIKAHNQNKIQFDASKIINSPQKYSIKIKARADKYFDSEFAEMNGEYNYFGVLQTPVITLDGSNINWNKIQYANFYDIEATSQNPAVKNVYRVQTNTFDVSTLLVDAGVFRFRVKAISENVDYLESIYSNTITIENKKTLQTPYNLKINHDFSINEEILTFVSSENVDAFVINVDNQQFSLSSNSSYIIQSKLDDNAVNKADIKNMYAVKLNSMLKGNGINLPITKSVNISVRAISTTDYILNSSYSSSVTYQFHQVLDTPLLQVNESDGSADISITPIQSQYLSGYAIYLDDTIFKTFSPDITEISVPLNKVGNRGIRVQAISNNNNCYSSNLSDVKYAINPTNTFDNITVVNEQGVLSWNSIENATYFVEISNSIFRTALTTSQTSINLNQYGIGKYKVKLIAFGENYFQKETSFDVNVSKKLDMVSGVEVISISGEPYIQFDEVEGAYGYVLYRGGVVVSKIFTSTSICLTEYLAVASNLNISLRAIGSVGELVEDSELTDEFVWQNITILPDPKLSIRMEDGKYYLSINVDENYASLSAGLSVWLDYTKISGTNGLEYKDCEIDITSQLSLAGKHEFMVKALAVNEDNIRDSRLITISKICYQQLGVVTGINVEINNTGDYILIFDEQTLAANYQVQIVKAQNGDYMEEFVIPGSYAPITQYVADAGTYRIYVKAIAIKGSYYTDSATSGNPYKLTKGLTLDNVNNLKITKDSNNQILVSWDEIKNCSGYQVNIYYQFNNLTKLIKTLETSVTSLDIGEGNYKSINKEGLYTVEVKALGSKSYGTETGKYTVASYNYIAEKSKDFRRNTVEIFGTTQDYYIDTLDDLKYLLWYHYLYNDEVWNYSPTLSYNLKVYCKTDLNVLAQGCGDTIAMQVRAMTYSVDKMRIIGQALLNQYPLLSAYTEGVKNENGAILQNFCLNEDANVYMFRYVNILDKDKLDRFNNQANVFPAKIDEIEPFYQRSENYIFALDTVAKTMDVTTTEQLYLAVQYGAKPNFIGECTVAKQVYENARKVLRTICDDGMTEYDKVVQIFDYLTTKIKYSAIIVKDGNSGSVTKDGKTSKVGNMADNYLEGIFYDLNNQQATSLGLSKAFVLLCSLEGIDAIGVHGTINGTISNQNHFWNKVYLNIKGDGYRWYAVDIASSKAEVVVGKNTSSEKTYQVNSHKYLLVTDAYLNTTLGSQTTFINKKVIDEYEGDYSADTEFNFYEYQKYSAKYGNYEAMDESFKYSSENGGIDEQVKNLLMYAMLRANNYYCVVVDMDISGYVGIGDVNNLISDISSEYYNEVARTRLNSNYNCILNTSINGNVLIVTFIPIKNPI